MAGKKRTITSDNYPLHNAVKNEDMKMLKKMIKSGFYKDDLKDEEGQTPLDLAIQLQNCTAIELLITYGSKSIDQIQLSKESEEFIQHKNVKSNKKILLFNALYGNRRNTIKALVHWGLDINHEDNESYDLLDYAIKMEDLSLIYFLFDLGIDVNRISCCTLEDVISSNNIELVKLFLAQDINLHNFPFALIHAIKSACDTKILEMLLDHGAIYIDSQPAITQAVLKYCGSVAVQVIQLLMQYGFDINETDYRGSTALHETVWFHNDLNMLYFILYCGAKVDVDDISGYTPIINALVRYRETSFQTLLFCKPDTVLDDLKNKFYGSMYTAGYPANYHSDEIDVYKFGMVMYLIDFSNDIEGGIKYLRPEHLLYYYAKRVVINLKIDERLEKIKWNKQKLELFKNECKDELDRMKKTKIYKDVTFYDILFASKQRLTYLIEKPEVLEAFVNRNTANFGIYEAMLNRNLLIGILFQPFYEISTLDEDDAIFEAFGICLPDHIHYKIKNYLSRDDLINWELAKRKNINKSNIAHLYDIPKIISTIFCLTLKIIS